MAPWHPAGPRRIVDTLVGGMLASAVGHSRMQKAVPPGQLIGAPPDPVLEKVRIPLIQRATLTYGRREEEVFVVDLGLGGVFVERREALPVGDTVEIRFPLPGNEILVTARCGVAWCHPEGAPLVSRSLPPGLGLEFLEISEEDRGRLRRHLLDHFRRGPGARRFSRLWPQTDEERADP